MNHVIVSQFVDRIFHYFHSSCTSQVPNQGALHREPSCAYSQPSQAVRHQNRIPRHWNLSWADTCLAASPRSNLRLKLHKYLLTSWYVAYFVGTGILGWVWMVMKWFADKVGRQRRESVSWKLPEAGYAAAVSCWGGSKISGRVPMHVPTHAYCMHVQYIVGLAAVCG